MPVLQKGFAEIILVTLIVVVGLGVLGYFVFSNGQIKFPDYSNDNGTENQEKHKAAGWNVYDDSLFGFTVSYPPTATLASQGISISRLPDLKNNNDSLNYEDALLFGLDVNTNNQNYSPEEYVEQIYCGGNIITEESSERSKMLYESCVKGFIDTKQDITIDGMPAVKGSYNPYEHAASVAILKKENLLYNFRLTGYETGNSPTQSARETFDQIIAGFTFGNSTDGKENWMLYKDPQFGFSFYYPLDTSASKNLVFYKTQDDKELLNISIKALKNTQNLTSDEYVLKEICPQIPDDPPNIDFYNYYQELNEKCVSLYNQNNKPINLNGAQALKGAYEKYSEYAYFYLIPQNDNFLLFTVSSYNKIPSSENVQMFDQILSTFKFTNDDINPIVSRVNDGCVIGGCSGEICAEEERASTCELKPGAVCYKSATCERQSNGNCGWTQTEELKTCLNKY